MRPSILLLEWLVDRGVCRVSVRSDGIAEAIHPFLGTRNLGRSGGLDRLESYCAGTRRGTL